MSADSDTETRPWWREDLFVIVAVCLVMLIAVQIPDGTSRPEVLLGAALVVGLLLRVGRRGWHRASSGRQRP